jgi:release factor glutamine methyltransferase
LLPWKNKSFDIIVANLPYGWKAWKNNTSAETVGLKFEPTEALFTTKKGLALYEQLLKQVSSLSPAPRSLFLEFDPRQTKQMKKLAKKLLPMYLLEIKKDLSKKNRFAYLHRKNSR